MLYEMITVVRSGSINEVKEIARQAGTLILASGGVIRGLTNWGTYLLTKPIRIHKKHYSDGHHFIMRYDCASHTQSNVRKMLKLDPRVIRFGVVKMGSRSAGGNGTLEGIKDLEGGKLSDNSTNYTEEEFAKLEKLDRLPPRLINTVQDTEMTTERKGNTIIFRSAGVTKAQKDLKKWEKGFEKDVALKKEVNLI
ncbi:MAG: 28S ribosomal protein S6, mitochondrial [Icmadophila ericetorum]|nr:28S ribosomal protein S6, mitochondrial [Icmadophila ericetorum]